MSNLKDLVEFLVRSLVDNPQEVKVNQIEGERTIIFEVRVASDDLGKVIGKEGRIANALRTIVKAAAMKEKKKVSLEIIP